MTYTAYHTQNGTGSYAVKGGNDKPLQNSMAPAHLQIRRLREVGRS